MKIFLFIFLGLIVNFNLSAQEVITTSGDTFKKPGASISWTMGEMITETIGANGIALTQGFQQTSFEIITSMGTKGYESMALKVGPNPTTDRLVLFSENPIAGQLSYVLTDISGKELLKGIISSSEIEVQTAELKAGSYILSVLKEGVTVKSFVVIKK